MMCLALLSAGLDQNNYSREACVEHYKAYKSCKQQEVHSRWLHSMAPKGYSRPCCISYLDACRSRHARSADSRHRRAGKAGSPEQCDQAGGRQTLQHAVTYTAAHAAAAEALPGAGTGCWQAVRLLTHRLRCCGQPSSAA